MGCGERDVGTRLDSVFCHYTEAFVLSMVGFGIHLRNTVCNAVCVCVFVCLYVCMYDCIDRWLHFLFLFG